MTVWQRWLRQPQSLFLRRLVFQVHLWTGLAVGLYIVMISLTGSVLVYRNELYTMFSPTPMIVEGSGAPLSVEELTSAAERAYPSYRVSDVRPGATANHAVEIMLRRGEDEPIRRRFHPFTSEDLGHPLPAGYRVTAWLLDLHDNLLAGPTGRRVNGVGALMLLLLCASGAVIWWPGVRNWRRSATVDLRSNWKRVTWSLHSALGLWFFAFLLLWAVTGSYLAYPDVFGAIFDRIEPLDETNPVERVVDRIQYWLAFLHFGRLGGRGIPGCGRGLCNSLTKATWAAAGLVPTVMFVTGALMWWNRIVGPAARQTTDPPRPEKERDLSAV